MTIGMDSADKGSLLDKSKQRLFDLQLVCEMVVAGIILFSTEMQRIEIDEDEVADFVIKNFPQILNSITESDSEEG